MQYPRCRTENRAEARFCCECRATFSAVCPISDAKVEAGTALPR